MKAYPSLTPDYVLHKMSFANIILYSSVIPSLDKKEDSRAVGNIETSNNAKGLTTNQFLNGFKQLRYGK